MKPVVDFHTHALRHNAIVNRTPGEALPEGYTYSVGIHPWDADKADEDAWNRLEEALQKPEVVAVGECGFDRLKGPSLDVQEAVFARQAALSEKYGKPMTIHCVRAFDRLLALHKRLRPHQKWTVHGFRGKPALALQLLDAGMDISMGPRFNPETLAVIPADRLHIETDDDPTVTIEAVAEKILG